MRLNALVPTLALVASATTASAIEVDALTIGGYVDAVLNITSNDIGADKWGGPSDELGTDFTAAFQLDVDYAIGEQAAARAELKWDQDGNTALEEAYASWQFHDKWSVHMGRFETFIGWESLDAPNLTRVNFHNAGSLSEVSPYYDGASVRGALTEQLSLGLYVADQLIAPSVARADSSQDLAFGAELSYALDDNDSYVDLDFTYDSYSAGLGGTGFDSIWSVNINAQYNFAEGTPLSVYGEFNYASWANDGTAAEDSDNNMWFMLGASYGFADNMIGSLMIDWIDPSDTAEDDAELEIAAALLTNPTNDANFAVNVEVAYISAEADDSNAFGVFLEALAIIP